MTYAIEPPNGRLDPTPHPLCGTIEGWRRHQLWHENPCEFCLMAKEAEAEFRHIKGNVKQKLRNRAKYATLEGRAAVAAENAAQRDRYKRRTPLQADADFDRLRPDGCRCPGCGQVLPRDAFGRNLHRANGRERRCRLCTAVRRNRYRHRDELHAEWAARGIDPAVCIYCGGPATDVEHVMPSGLGGADDTANLAPSCGPCNRQKRDRHPALWLADAHPDRFEVITALFPHISPKEEEDR